MTFHINLYQSVTCHVVILRMYSFTVRIPAKKKTATHSIVRINTGMQLYQNTSITNSIVEPPLKQKILIVPSIK